VSTHSLPLRTARFPRGGRRRPVRIAYAWTCRPPRSRCSPTASAADRARPPASQRGAEQPGRPPGAGV